MEEVAARFRYIEDGNGGENLVLLHGLFGSPGNWDEVIENLAKDFHVYALQFPIDYHPNKSSREFTTIEELTRYTLDFMDENKIAKATIIGNSLGGQVAIDMCLNHSHRVEKLIITGSAGLFERHLTGGNLPKDVSREFIREKGKEIFYDPSHITDEIVENIHKMLEDRSFVRFLLRVAKSTRDYNVKEELEKIKFPTLIVWGSDDVITPPYVAEEFEEHLENATLRFIDQCGHTPPMEQPYEFSKIIREFLQESLSPVSH
jgi:pimeloyl-ACP methyl ester carboxylesterase